MIHDLMLKKTELVDQCIHMPYGNIFRTRNEFRFFSQQTILFLTLPSDTSVLVILLYEIVKGLLLELYSKILTVSRCHRYF